MKRPDGRTPLAFFRSRERDSRGWERCLSAASEGKGGADKDALDLVERDLVGAAVVEAGGAGAFVVGHLLGDFEFAAIAEVFGDAGDAEVVAADLGFDAGAGGAAADHAVDVGLGHGPACEASGGAQGGGEEPGLGIWGQGRGKGRGVVLEVGLELVVAGHLVVLAALLAEPDPGPVPLNEHVPSVHLHDSPDAGEGVDHEGDQGAVAEARQRIGHDRIEQVAGFCGREDGRLAFREIP